MPQPSGNFQANVMGRNDGKIKRSVTVTAVGTGTHLSPYFPLTAYREAFNPLHLQTTDKANASINDGLGNRTRLTFHRRKTGHADLLFRILMLEREL